MGQVPPLINKDVSFRCTQIILLTLCLHAKEGHFSSKGVYAFQKAFSGRL